MHPLHAQTQQMQMTCTAIPSSILSFTFLTCFLGLNVFHPGIKYTLKNGCGFECDVTLSKRVFFLAYSSANVSLVFVAYLVITHAGTVKRV